MTISRVFDAATSNGQGIREQGIGFSRIVFGLVILLAFANQELIAWQQSGDELTQQATEADTERVKVIAKAREASICVFSTDGQGGGSGVIVSKEGFALTNYHVVKPCGHYMHCSTSNGQVYDAVLVGVDPVGDVAVIKLIGQEEFPVAEYGDSDNVHVGESCFAIGNPFLLATNLEPSVSWGIVSGVHRYQYPAGTLLEYADCIQTDAAINPGNSGGPLFNSKGQLIGVNGRGSFEKRGRVNVGVGYAISSNQIRLFWNHLVSGRIVDHATLGATASSDATGRVVVGNILPNTDAYRRGLRYDDEIVSFGGRDIGTVNEFKNVLGIYPAGWTVPLVWRREGILYEADVRLQAVHSPEKLIDMVQVKPPAEQPKSTESPGRLKARVPADVESQYEYREGFANYHFNRLWQQQIWNSLQSSGATTALPAKWKLTGVTPDNLKVRFALDANNAGMQWGDSAAVLDLNKDLAAQRVPDGTGGLLVAMHVWQMFLSQGSEAFGELVYQGGNPGTDGMIDDMLVGKFQTVEARIVLGRLTSRLARLELWTDPGLDPCEIRFSDYREVNQVFLPHRLSVKNGEQFQWEISIQDWQFE